jgi:hypothetical protein
LRKSGYGDYLINLLKGKWHVSSLPVEPDLLEAV